MIEIGVVTSEIPLSVEVFMHNLLLSFVIFSYSSQFLASRTLFSSYLNHMKAQLPCMRKQHNGCVIVSHSMRES